MSKIDRQEILERLMATGQKAISFHRVFPPDKKAECLSYLGGTPKLPSNLQWPLTENLKLPYTFLGQISIDSLSEISEGLPLPPRGTLYFFINSSEDKTEFAKVLYSPRNAEELPTAELPDTPCPIFRKASHNWKYDWITQEEYEADTTFWLLPKWSLRPVSIRTYSSERDILGLGEEEYDFNLIRDVIFELQFPQDGGSSVSAYKDNSFSSSELFKRVDHGFLFLDSDFPYTYIFIEIFSGIVKYEMMKAAEEVDTLLSNGQLSSKDYSAVKQRYDSALEKAQAWLKTSTKANRYTSIDPFTKKKFRSWCDDIGQDELYFEEHVQKQQKEYRSAKNWKAPAPKGHGDRLAHYKVTDWLKEAFLVGSDLLSENGDIASKILSEDTMNFLRWKRHNSEEICALLGHRYCEEGNLKDHIILMSFATDEVMRWRWGDLGQIFFWIKEEDLKQLRFDNIKVTIEGW